MTIIDEKAKFIFIANMKTASTSIHYFFLNKYEINNELYDNRNDVIISYKTKIEKPIGKHDSYIKISNFIKNNKDKYGDINDYYIFGFIREPINKFISCYKYKKQKYNYKHNINTYIINYCEKEHFSSINEMFLDKNNELPKNVHIFKVENIKNSMKKICSKLNLKYTKLDNLNKTNNEYIYISENIKNIIIKRYILDYKLYH